VTSSVTAYLLSLSHLGLRIMAAAPHRSAEQLIAALAAGEIDLREFLVEARPLRGDDVLLPAAVRDALFDRLPTVPAITGRNGPLGTLCEMFTITQLISGIMFTIVVLDEQVILFNCINGHLGAFAYSRYAVEDALQGLHRVLRVEYPKHFFTTSNNNVGNTWVALGPPPRDDDDRARALPLPPLPRAPVPRHHRTLVRAA
jgi:hypothetical protein